MSDAKCTACERTVATHAAGCSHVVCPHRGTQNWGCPSDGSQGYPGLLAEDRVIALRREERHRALEVGLEEL